MNREIKFRAWDTFYKEMEYEYHINCNDFDADKGLSQIPLNEEFVSKRFVFQQFTGLKDKNDKEIYEGDILESFYNKESFKDVVEYITNGFYAKGLGNYLSVNILAPKNKIVIGNIYENPELLK